MDYSRRTCVILAPFALIVSKSEYVSLCGSALVQFSLWRTIVLLILITSLTILRVVVFAESRSCCCLCALHLIALSYIFVHCIP